MKNNVDIAALIKPIAKAFRQFHTTIFIVLVVGGLMYAVITLSNVVRDGTTGNSAQTINTTPTFDTSVVDQLQALHTSDQTPPTVTFPSGRINPFVE